MSTYLMNPAIVSGLRKKFDVIIDDTSIRLSHRHCRCCGSYRGYHYNISPIFIKRVILRILRRNTTSLFYLVYRIILDNYPHRVFSDLDNIHKVFDKLLYDTHIFNIVISSGTFSLYDAPVIVYMMARLRSNIN